MVSADTARVIAGRYALHRAIGHGGMSSVYLAHDERLGREVAVKLLHPSLAGDPDFVERFRREAQRAAALSHPNIAAVYDWGEDAGTHYLVMEYVPGSTLKEVILRRGRRPEREALEVCREIAAALGEAHRHGVVHRDIKPQNVLLDTEGGVKVVDFGIALATGESQLTQTGTILGSAHYAAPEQIQRQAVDGRADLYSLGAVLYELLTGKPPFMADSPVAIAWQHVHEAPEPPSVSAPGVSEAAPRIALKALRKAPDQRYQSAADLIADIDAALAGRSLRADETVTIALPTVPVAPVAASAAATSVLPHTVRHPAPERRERSGRALLFPAVLAVLLLLPLSLLALRARPAQNVAAPAPGVTGAPASAGVAGVAATAPPEPTPAATEAPTPVPTLAPTTARPTTPPTQAPPPTLAPAVTGSPVSAVSGFYSAAASGRYAEAAARWSDRMRTAYPPAQNIDERFAQTQSLMLNGSRVLEQTADRALVAVDLTEVIGNPPETRRWVGTWTLVRSGGEWLLDAPNLTRG